MKLYPLLFAIILILCSCRSQKYLFTNNSGDLSDLPLTSENYEYIIKPDDKINFSIWDNDNLSIGSVFSIYNSNEAYGKWVLVEANGQVSLPKSGVFQLGGLTCSEASDSLETVYSKYLVNPIIVVKVMNRTVSVLGEVRTPGNYLLEKDKNNISDAIGFAQGYMNYADLNKIQLIRENISYTIDLSLIEPNNPHSILIKSGDIIVVPSQRRKIFEQKASTIIPFASAVTAIGIIATLFLK